MSASCCSFTFSVFNISIFSTRIYTLIIDRILSYVHSGASFRILFIKILLFTFYIIIDCCSRSCFMSMPYGSVFKRPYS